MRPGSKSKHPVIERITISRGRYAGEELFYTSFHAPEASAGHRHRRKRKRRATRGDIYIFSSPLVTHKKSVPLSLALLVFVPLAHRAALAETFILAWTSPTHLLLCHRRPPSIHSIKRWHNKRIVLFCLRATDGGCGRLSLDNTVYHSFDRPGSHRNLDALISRSDCVGCRPAAVPTN